MDQIKIGRFIAFCRKEQGMTQAVLAEKLGISDRAVSKWETGKSMPDVGIMLDLCDHLGINVNELLSGERIMTDQYEKKAEENLLELTRENEKLAARLLKMEYVIGYTATITFFVMIFVASFVELPMPIKIGMIVLALIIFAVGVAACFFIEQKAGYYECSKCHHRYVPSYRQVFFAPHLWRSRYMKCPNCGERSLNRKVLTKEKQDR